MLRVTFPPALVLLVIAPASGAPPAKATTTRPATTVATTQALAHPDPHLWTRRNLDLIRGADARTNEPMGSGAIGNVLMFSLGTNPLLIRDPYAEEALAIVEAALADEGTHERARPRLEAAARFLRLTEDERVLRQFSRGIEADDLDKPVVRGQHVYSLTNTLAAMTGQPLSDALATSTIDKMDAAARAAGNWDGLALAYQRLASPALARNLPDRANLYIDRMLAILREHSRFQDPNRGNTDAVSGRGVASVLVQAGRERDVDALLGSMKAQEKAELLLGMAAAYADRDRLSDVRPVVEQLRAIAPADAEQLAAALDGRAEALKPTPTGLILPPRQGAMHAIAYAYARRGDVELAGRLTTDWKGIGLYAHRAGHDAAARVAFERALEHVPVGVVDPPRQTEEKVRFVRDALDVGEGDLAYGILRTTSAPGASGYYALSIAWRKRGDDRRADELLEHALAIAGKGRGGGNVMADIAADLHAAGEVQRAEELLTRAIDHIEGVDFGFSGTRAIVRAAMRMNRLDLLDRLYDWYDPGERMLLCITAARAGFFSLAEHDERQ